MKLTVISDIEISIDVVNEINDHLEKGIPFILFDDKDHYLRVYPMQRRVRCYVAGKCASEEQLNDEAAFQIRLQTGLLVYKNFFSLVDEAPKIQQGNGETKLIEQPEMDGMEYEEDKLLD